MRKGTPRPIDARWRDSTTDEAIVGLLADSNGEMNRRDLSRKIGHRYDFSSALARLTRKGKIELVAIEHPGRRPQPVVRLIGADAVTRGVGFLHLRKETP